MFSTLLSPASFGLPEDVETFTYVNEHSYAGMPKKNFDELVEYCTQESLEKAYAQLSTHPRPSNIQIDKEEKTISYEVSFDALVTYFTGVRAADDYIAALKKVLKHECVLIYDKLIADLMVVPGDDDNVDYSIAT